MKKGLFLLPLAGALLLSGCTFTLFGKTITLFEKAQESGGGSGSGTGGSGSGSSGGSGGSGGGGSVTPGIATVNLYGCADVVDKTASPMVFTNGGCSVTISQGTSGQTVPAAATASKTYEFRIYQNFELSFESETAFSKLEVLFSTYAQQDGKTYYFDYDNLDGATNSVDTTDGDGFKNTGKATITLDEASTSFSIASTAVFHQSRVRSVKFVA